MPFTSPTGSYLPTSDIFPSIGEMIGRAFMTGIIILAIEILIAVLIIRAICKYQAKKNAEAFKYDYLAERIAEEICKRQMIIEKNKKEHQETPTNIQEEQISNK